MDKINKKMTYKTSKKTLNIISTKIKKFVIVFLFIVSFLLLGAALSSASGTNITENTDSKTIQRVNEIRNSKNTDISKRTGKVFYVSSTGNDDNDGLSPEKAWKTLEKINTSFYNKKINETDTILLKRGDTFRGNINITADEILIGSYGDEKLAKPEILVSPYNGAVEGEWTEVEENIWKYTVNGENPFTNDVGVIWFHSNDNTASNKMVNIDGSFEYGKKVTTDGNVDETTLDISTILDENFEFYHVGHACSGKNTGKELYLYLEQNPKEKFDRIEFAIADHGINLWGFTNAIIDNITIKYAGIHGICAGTVANLKVTNCELGYIGGVVQGYGTFAENKPVRFGNAVEIYGSVTEKDGYDVEEGFIVRNNYIYQVYDAGITFQYTAEGETRIENAVFDNNVVEYCNYNIEYWNVSESTDRAVQENTYISNYEITNNIMRYAGSGVSQTRPDKKQSAHIKAWPQYNEFYNNVKGKYIISNNIFDTSSEQAFCIYAGNVASLPEIKNNTFYNSYNIPFGYYCTNPPEYEYVIPYTKRKLETLFPNNKFNYIENDLDSYSCSGVTGEVNWNYDNATGVLTITGSGRMKDYTKTELPEWYRARMFINKIIIEEDITHIGNYAFYDLPYVEEIEINSKQLDDFSSSGINIGDNYSFYKTGSSWKGMEVTIGENVTVIPAYMFWPAEKEWESPNVKNLVFKGNKIKEIRDHAFHNLKVPVIIIPDGVQKIEALAFANTSSTIAISVPDSVEIVDPWAFAGSTKLEKIVFGKNVSKISEYMLSASRSLKEAIFQSNIEFASSNYNGLFSQDSTNTIIYGNDSVRKIVNNYKTSTNTNNIRYENMNEYKINITSNTDLIEIQNDASKSTGYQANKDIIFNAKSGYKIDNVNAYKIYNATNENDYTIGKVNISNTDGVYTIPSSYWDIYIDATVSKIQVEENKEEDKEEESNTPVDKEDEENTNKDDEQTENKDDEETTNKEDEETVNKDDEETTNKEDEETVNKDDEETTNKGDEETTNKEDEETTNKEDETVDKNDEEGSNENHQDSSHQEKEDTLSNNNSNSGEQKVDKEDDTVSVGALPQTGETGKIGFWITITGLIIAAIYCKVKSNLK